MNLRKWEQTGRAGARAGFTLMELLVVVAILLVLVGVATPIYFSYLGESKVRIARTDAVRLAGELDNFRVLNNGEFPPPGDWSLLPLKKNPPLDPWNNPYGWNLTTIQQATGSMTVPIVWSWGPNKTDEGGGGDDITNQ